MKNRKMNNVLSGLLALVMLLCLGVSATAATVEPDRPGSITLTLRDQQAQAPVMGGEVTLYRVADTRVTDGQLSFAFLKEFQDCALAIEDYAQVAFAEGLADYIAQKKPQGTALVTDAAGRVRFADLPHGLYAVMQTKAAEGFSAFAPFIAQLPMTVDSEWVYDLDVTPKVDVVRYTDITVQKVWNDDNGAGATQRPENVTIRLLLHGEVMETVTLSEANGWKHTWEHLVQQEGYSVQEVNVPKGYKVTYQREGFSFTVTNTATLVQTGQLNWPIPVLIVSGMVLIVVGYVLRNRGKRYE